MGSFSDWLAGLALAAGKGQSFNQSNVSVQFHP